MLHRETRAGLLVAGCAGLALWFFAWNAGRQVSSDFASSYFAARAIEAHANPYDLAVLKSLSSRSQYGGEVFPYLYPPFVCAIVMLPFAAVSYATALTAWFWCNAALMLAGTFVLFRVAAAALPATQERRWNVLVLAVGCLALVLLFYPVAENFRWAQINPLIFFGLILFVWFLGAGRDILAGFCLAVIILIKIAPIVLLVYLMAAKRYRAAAAAVGFVLALTLISSAVIGTANAAFYVERVLPALSFGKPVPQLPYEIAGYPGNYSLNGLLSSLFVESMLGDRLPWRDRDLGALLYSLISFGFLVDLTARVRKAVPSNRSLGQLLLIGNAVVVYSLISPITSEHHLVALAIPLVAVLISGLEATPGTASTVWIVCASIVLAVDAEAWYFKPLFSFYGRHPGIFDGHPVRQYAFLLALPVKTYAMAVLWARTRRPRPAICRLA